MRDKKPIVSAWDVLLAYLVALIIAGPFVVLSAVELASVLRDEQTIMPEMRMAP